VSRLFRQLAVLVGVAVILSVVAGCGKRGALIPPEALVPAPVKDLAVAQKGARFQVSWSAPGKDVAGRTLRDLAGFELFRRLVLPPAEDCEDCPTAYQQMVRVDLSYLQGVRRTGNLFLYDDSDLTSGKIYQYKVRSFSKEGAQSSDSNRARHAVLAAPAPPVLEAISSPAGVVLAYLAPAPKEGKLLGYNIYRTKKGGVMPPAPLNPAPLAATTYEDKLQLLGVPYDYQVTTVAVVDGETVESPPSNLVESEMQPRE
jgi:hypothetical protein